MTKEVLTLALEALEQIAAYRPLTFAECSDAEAVMRIAENAIPALRLAIDVQNMASESTYKPQIAFNAEVVGYIAPQRTEPVCPECKAGVLYECVACSSNNYPPQRTWVNLTDREFEEVTHGMEDLEDCWIAIEDALRKKNI
jgi:hypothetical protein